MFHIAAYSESHAAGSLIDIQPAQDTQLQIVNNHYLFEQRMAVLFACAMNADMVRARLRTPTIQLYPSLYIRPVEGNATPGNDPGVCDWRQNPPSVNPLEEFVAEAETDQAMGNQQTTILVGLTPGITPAPQGEPRTIRGTSTTAAVAHAWTQVTVTWDDQLPAGQYECVGLEAFGATEIAARLNFHGQYWRPGGLGMTDQENRTHPMFLRGGLGSWGRFTSNRMPNVEVFNTTTVNAHTFFMHYVRVG